MLAEDTRSAETELVKNTPSLTPGVHQERLKATKVVGGIRKKVSKLCRDLTEAKS